MRDGRVGPGCGRCGGDSPQVKEAGVPSVSQQLIIPGLLIGAPPAPAAAVLIDAQVRHRRRDLLQHRIRCGGERLMRDPVAGQAFGTLRDTLASLKGNPQSHHDPQTLQL